MCGHGINHEQKHNSEAPEGQEGQEEQSLEHKP